MFLEPLVYDLFTFKQSVECCNVLDLESNDSYSLTMDQEGASPHSRYLHGDTSTPPYLSSPSHPLPYSGEPYPPLGESSEGDLLTHLHYL